MRQSYATSGVVLRSRPLGEESALLSILTAELGLIHARAQGVKKSGAKLAGALQTLSASDLTLVAGREGWRVRGAVPVESWFSTLAPEARTRAARVAALLLRLVPADEKDGRYFALLTAFLTALQEMPLAAHEALECLMVLRTLEALGLETGDLPGNTFEPFSIETLREVERKRMAFVTRANMSLAASGL